MQFSRRPITLKCNRPSATRRLARRSTSWARGHREIPFSLWGWGRRLACHRLGPPFVCQYVKDRGDTDSAGEADVCRGQSGGGPTQESCSCCKVKSFCQPSRAIRCDWVRLGEITWDNGWWEWNETQGDARRRKETEIPCCRSFEQMAGASEGKVHHRKGLREEDILGREGPWKKRHHSTWEASEKRRAFQLFQYSSIPVFQYSN